MVIENGTVQIWRIPELPANIPDWLPDLAELVGGQSLDSKGLTHPVARDGSEKLKQIVRVSGAGEAFTGPAKRILGGGDIPEGR